MCGLYDELLFFRWKLLVYSKHIRRMSLVENFVLHRFLICFKSEFSGMRI